jgi:hypothetical protein
MKAHRLISLGAALVLLGCHQGPITDPDPSPAYPHWIDVAVAG